MTTIDIVCTTINDGMFLASYTREIVAAGAQNRVRMIVIPDRKTPRELYQSVQRARKHGIVVLCPDPITQADFLLSLGVPDGTFPWDSDGRRNIGYLMAWRDGTDIMISIDDDNLLGRSWLQAHEVVAEAAPHSVVSSSSGFWNPCALLESVPLTFYPRGYPYSARVRRGLIDTATYSWGEVWADVAVNAGLWIGDPDVDAVTRLAVHPETHRVTGSAVLARHTWAPVNSQNTAVRREAIPAYCFFESAKRFADIWQGYFVQACAKHLGQHVRFGTPVTDCAVRNDHDLLNDLRLEYDGIMMADDLLDWLTQLKLSGSTYAETYDCLADELIDYADSAAEPAAAILHGMVSRMQQWLKIIGQLA